MPNDGGKGAAARNYDFKFRAIGYSRRVGGGLSSLGRGLFSQLPPVPLVVSQYFGPVRLCFPPLSEPDVRR